MRIKSLDPQTHREKDYGMAVPDMASIQGKLKASIVFDPDDIKAKTFQSYRQDMEEYFDEFVIGFVLSEEWSDYNDNDDGNKPLKRFNAKIARRYIYSTLRGDAETLA